MKKVQWGNIGPGAIATNFAAGLGECDSGELVAIASRSAERLAGFGDKFAIAPQKRYGSYAELIADSEIDAVHIATPHPFHAQLAIDAMRAGKHVSLEKPMALNNAEAAELAVAAGVDLVMLSSLDDASSALERVVVAVNEGRIAETSVTESFLRVMQTRSIDVCAL